MGLTVKTADMTAVLDKFEVGYKFPIYTTVCNMSGFTASKKNQHPGYVAISDDGHLLIVDYSLIKGETLYKIPLMSIQSVKISKVPLLGSKIVKVEFLNEGKKMRYDLTITAKIIGSDLDSHTENAAGLINVLSQYE